MITLSLSQIAQITGGKVHGDPDIEVTGGVEFDSRRIEQGGLFLALAGAKVDGHTFAPQTIENGAAGVLAFRDVDAPSVIVPPVEKNAAAARSYALEHDTDGAVEAVLAAMGKLARHVVDTLVAEHDMLVVGVTGSAGKTSTKDIMASIFSAAGETIAPPGSFNNEIGHPYTALKCDETTQFLIAEMSARGLGHVAHLARIAPPRIGVVLNVGSAHIGEFGSREVIAQAKGELVEALPSADNGGVAVLNLDDDAVAGMAPRTSAKVLYFSAAGDERAQVRATNVSLDAQARPHFTLHVDGQDPRQVTLGIYGIHQVDNALAAIAAGVGAGLDLDLIVAAVQGHTNVSAHRMDVQSRADGATIINDAYNANPESMRAGLNALVATATGRDGARSFAVLGPMGELGDDGVAQHEKLAQVIAELGVNRLVAVGDNEYSKALASAATKLGTETSLAKDNDAAASIVAGELKEADVVLVKASNSFRLWEVAEKLLT